jgi:hypothetical protein
MSARWSPDGNSFVACSTREATVRLYAAGFEEPDATEDLTAGEAAGIPILFIIAAIGLFILFYTLQKELREHRK